MTSSSNLSVSGNIKYKRVVYASRGLDYTSSPDLQNYCIFEHPDVGFVTGRVNISKLGDFHYNGDWPFCPRTSPINGILCMPVGQGPFPLAIFVHGLYNYKLNSAPGFLYLCDLLASYGILAATIDVGFLNSIDSPEEEYRDVGRVAARAILLLEHLKQIRIWSDTKENPLHKKVELSKIMIVGHSFGGEAVGHASYFNRIKHKIDIIENNDSVIVDGSQGLGPYNFNIKTILGLAPTYQAYIPPSGESVIYDNYIIMQGSRDYSNTSFQGHLVYDQLLVGDIENSAQPEFKSLLWIYKANHNFFNSLWDAESSEIEILTRDGRESLTRNDQLKIAQDYISAIAKFQLLDQKKFKSLLLNYKSGIKNGWLFPETNYISQYQTQTRVDLQNFELQSSAFPSLPQSINGRVFAAQITLKKQPFFRPQFRPTKPSPRNTEGNSFDVQHHLYQDNYGLRIDWIEHGGTYSIDFDDISKLELHQYNTFSFRVGQSFERNNAPGESQDFSITFSDHVKNISFPISQIHEILYPDDTDRNIREPTTVLQTIFISFNELRKCELCIDCLSSIKFVFDQKISGTVYLDDIQFTLI